tara:strand:+ start:241 stop:603 length:363 start_codon:yes stop_codon:yes gene_type:complete
MTEQLSGCTITCHFSFTKPQEAEGFSAYDLMRLWARQEINGLQRDQTIFLDDEDLIETKPWIPLKRIKLHVPQRDEPYISTAEDEEQYRLSNPKKISNTGFAHWLMTRFDITFEIASSTD